MSSLCAYFSFIKLRQAPPWAPSLGDCLHISLKVAVGAPRRYRMEDIELAQKRAARLVPDRLALS